MGNDEKTFLLVFLLYHRWRCTRILKFVILSFCREPIICIHMSENLWRFAVWCLPAGDALSISKSVIFQRFFGQFNHGN